MVSARLNFKSRLCEILVAEINETITFTCDVDLSFLLFSHDDYFWQLSLPGYEILFLINDWTSIYPFLHTNPYTIMFSTYEAILHINAKTY